MPILNIQISSAGKEGIFPRIVYIETNDPLSTVFTTGYLNQAKALNFAFLTTDMVLISTTDNPNTFNNSVDFLQVTFSNGNWSFIEPIVNVILPTIANHIATYLDSTGKLTEDPTIAITAGNLQASGGNIIAGQSGTQGVLKAYNPGSAHGALIFEASNNAGNFGVNIITDSHAFNTQYTLTDVQSATGSILTSSVDDADPCANLIAFDTFVNASALAGGGIVTLGGIIGGGRIYRIRELYINQGGGINFSSGDRQLLITDSGHFTNYSFIPAATLQSLVNARWGTTALPFPPSSGALNTPLHAGSNLTAQYNGGTTDYLVGSVLISGILERTT